MSFFASVGMSQTIISKADADYIFSLTKPSWEDYARKMVHPDGWKVRLSPRDTGTGVMAYDNQTRMGLSIQPFYKDENSLPDILIVGSYYPLGTLPKFTEDFKHTIEGEAKKDLGAEYSVSAAYIEMPPFEGVELLITKISD